MNATLCSCGRTQALMRLTSITLEHTVNRSVLDWDEEGGQNVLFRQLVQQTVFLCRQGDQTTNYYVWLCVRTLSLFVRLLAGCLHSIATAPNAELDRKLLSVMGAIRRCIGSRSAGRSCTSCSLWPGPAASLHSWHYRLPI